MSNLRTEIEKIFNKIDKDLQDDEENSMTIYDCFDFQEEDKDRFIDAIFILLVLFDYNIKSDFRSDMANEIIKCDNTLAQIIIEKLCDRKFIHFERCKDICNFLDVEFEKYKTLYHPTPLVEVAKDYQYLSKLMESFDKKDN